jgi:hypothetical protein
MPKQKPVHEQLWIFCVSTKEFTPLVRCTTCEQHQRLTIVDGVPVVDCEVREEKEGKAK